MSIGDKLKKMRFNSKKTLKEISEVFGVSLNTVYRWEHDLCLPQKSTLKKIIKFYDVPYEWLFNANEGLETNKCDDCIFYYFKLKNKI